MTPALRAAPTRSPASTRPTTTRTSSGPTASSSAGRRRPTSSSRSAVASRTSERASQTNPKRFKLSSHGGLETETPILFFADFLDCSPRCLPRRCRQPPDSAVPRRTPDPVAVAPRAVRRRLGRARGAVGGGGMAPAVPADRHLEPARQRGARGGLPGRHPPAGGDRLAGGRQPGGAGQPVRPALVAEERRAGDPPAPSHGRRPPGPGVDRAAVRRPGQGRAALGARRDRRQEPRHRPARRDGRPPAPAGAAGARRHLPRRGRRGERRRAGHRLARSPTIRSSSRGSRR